MRIKSVLHSNDRGYLLESDYDWNSRGNAALSLYIKRYETCGDGQTQHSPGWTAQWSDLVDVCISFAQAITADPLNPEWKTLGQVFYDVRPDTIRFAMDIKFREDKRQWFNFSERKVSAVASKEYDKRWTRVESNMDGTPAATVSIILNQVSHYDFLSKLALVMDVRDAYDTYPDYESMFKPLENIEGDWQQAFQAFRFAAQAIEKLGHANRLAENAANNSAPKVEATVEEVPTVAETKTA